MLSKPCGQLRQTVAAVFDPSFGQGLAIAADQTNAVLVRAPVNSGKEMKSAVQRTPPA